MTFDPKEARALVKRLDGYTPGPWTCGQAARPVDGCYDWGVKAYVNGNYEVVAESFARSSESIYPPAEANARLIAAAPDLHAHLAAALDKIERLQTAIKRQAGAAKTLRESTLAEVQHIRDAERKEYTATKTLQSERDANAILTEENERLRATLSAITATDCYSRDEVTNMARAALKGDDQ
jgi:hypothetical protein